MGSGCLLQWLWRVSCGGVGCVLGLCCCSRSCRFDCTTSGLPVCQSSPSGLFGAVCFRVSFLSRAMIQIGVQLALDLSREPRVTVRAQLGFCIQRYGHGSSSPRCCEGGCYLCFRGVEIRTLRGGLRITSTSVSTAW